MGRYIRFVILPFLFAVVACTSSSPKQVNYAEPTATIASTGEMIPGPAPSSSDSEFRMLSQVPGGP